MTRVMFWNIEKFSRNKVANPQGLPQVGGALQQAAAAAQRLTLIMRMIQQANPDILIVVEVATGPGPAGGLVGGKGIEGALTLLANMQWAHQADWRLAPPLRTGNREGVAVFYRSTERVFSGPFLWPGGAGGAAAAGVPALPYEPRLNAAIGQGVVPAGSEYNAGVAENLCAAQTTGWTGVPNPLGAPNPPPALAPRTPYLTTFAEEAGGGMLFRDLAIFSIHSPANFAAGAYLAELALVNEIVKPLNGEEARVVAGDFNVNLIDAAGNRTIPYGPLLLRGFALGLQPAGPANFSAAARGYYATHIKRRKEAQFWPPGGAAYPGYGYIGSGRVANFFAIDNIFTAGGNPANFTILNPVVGSPFNAHPGPPGYAAPPGTIPINRRGGLPTPAAEPPQPAAVPNPAPGANIGEIQSFRGWNNYGRIRSTSDHFPIVMNV